MIGSTKEMQNVAGRLDRLVKELAPEPAPVAAEGEPSAPAKPGVASLVNQVHDLMLEQKQRTDEDASTAQRVDNLLNTMVEDRNSEFSRRDLEEGQVSQWSASIHCSLDNIARLCSSRK